MVDGSRDGSAGAALRESLLFVLADADSFADAVERTLAAICRAGEWEYGEAWVPEPAADGIDDPTAEGGDGGTERLALAATWAEPGYEAFLEATTAVSFGRDEGLVGRVWAGGDPEWVSDLGAADARFVRADAAAAVGLVSGVAVPLPHAGGAEVSELDPLAVLCFLTATPREADPTFASAVVDAVAETARLFGKRRAADAAAEERRLLDGVLDVTPFPVVVYDAAGAVERANEAARAAVGLDAAGLRERDRFDDRWELATPDGEPLGEADRPVSSALRTGEPAAARLRATLPTGERRTFDLRASPVVGDDGAVEHVVAAFSDVTESVAHERDLEARNDALGEFASVVSHDLRNPLAVVRGYVDLARETGEVGHLGPASEAVDRMDDLIRSLLLLARSGRAVGESRPVALADAVAEAWATVDSGAATLVVADDLPTVEADPVRFGQLLENLLANAVSHAGRAPAVRVEALADGAGFAVADDGPGIDPDRREAVFDPGHSTGGDGAGLGLTLVRTVAEAHGWHVAATGGVAGGARFEVRTDRSETA
ncbi:ATP-binding protein [Halobaculum litoreum]|uniref:histidine kinase n=1 Tax=Halobaculum litoreum TaxID=3031998 RepID=A0ABD5XM16_9EURY|nr:ATP-binding protein [Halobaculum sp. DT92]